MFDQDDARPEQVNEAVLAANVFDRLLKRGDQAAADAKDVEKFIPKGFALGFLAGFARPFFGKANGVVADFVPRKRHKGTLPKIGVARQGRGSKARLKLLVSEHGLKLYLGFSLSTCHIGIVVEKKPVQTAPKNALRYSFPPYYVGLMDGNVPIASFPGALYEDLARGFAPPAEEVRQMLLQLRGKLRWARSMLAALLGVSRDVVRRWETGERHPSGAARRLIWLLDLLVRHPEKLKTGMDLIFWGKGDECLEFHRRLARV